MPIPAVKNAAGLVASAWPAAGGFRVSRLGLSSRLSLLIAALMALVTVAGGVFVVLRARADIRDEVRSTMNLTEHFIDAQLALLRNHWSHNSDPSASIFQLERLHGLRHLEVRFYDGEGRLLEQSERSGEQAPEAPAWFEWIVHAASPPMADERREIEIDGIRFGELVMHPDPSSEIDEMWEISRGLLALLALFFVLVNALVWWSVSQAMRPVDLILRALGDVEHGRLESRLPDFKLPEMARIAGGFNHMTATLERSVAENHSLTRRLISTQEDERRNVARELHDEIGQCVTAIHADAAAIRNLDDGPSALREGADGIIEAVGRIKELVRSMLTRLRPATLDGHGLHAALRELVAGFGSRHPAVHCSLQVAEGCDAVDSEVGITAYRVVQECLTNVARHAGASHVEITLDIVNVPTMRISVLSIIVDDDGSGFDTAATVRGFGLQGMRERVRAHEGTCTIDSALGSGVKIRVSLPLALTLAMPQDATP